MNTNELADGINSPHNACCYRDKCRQLQAEIEQWGIEFDKLTDDFIKQQAEIAALKAKDLKKAMDIRSLNTQLKKALQYETFNR